MKYTLIPSLLLFCVACVGNKEVPLADADNAIPVEVQTVEALPIRNEIVLSGNVEGKTTVRLGFMVSGKVESIACKEGESVQEGQPLSRLEPASYILAKQLSDIQVNLAKDEFERLSLMRNRGSVSESDYTKAKLALQQAQVEQKIQEKNVNDTRILSPIAGVLLSKQTEVGEIVAAGTPLFVIADIKKVIVTVFVPEGELHQIILGQDARVNIGALNKTFTGKVTDVGALAEATSRAFTVKIEIDNRDLLIRPGMIAEATIAGKHQSESILVPVESIVHDAGNQNYIYVANKDARRAFRRKISLGQMIENNIQVVAGLATGEAIVTAGQSKLTDGVNITIVK